ncbi:hypothetical protein PI125_g16933 [Phytophthora idaei]|nr:hypothetical protein PI125_g16933 [Phytophthora idaei]
MVQRRAQYSDEDRDAAVVAVLAGGPMKTIREVTITPYSTFKAYMAAARKEAPQEPKYRGLPPLLPRYAEDSLRD